VTFDVVVLGGGPAGVGAAYRAARAGYRVAVIERAPAPGGAAGSFEVAGVRVDMGSHRLHPSIEPRILSDLRALLGDDLQRRTRRGRILLAGRWIAFPLRAGDVLSRLPPPFALSAAFDAATAWARRPRADTFAEVLRAGLGTTMCERFYYPYARKLWGLEPKEISGEQARRRVSADSPSKILKRLARGAKEPRSFFYPRRGYGAISEALAEAAEKEGAHLYFRCEATEVRLDRTEARVALSTGEVLEGATVFSTIPLPALARMCSPPPPGDVLAAAESLQFRSMLLVYLVLGAGRYTPYDAHYFPEEFTPVTRVSEPKNYRDGDDPPERTVLCAELPCLLGDDLWKRSDEDLGEVVASTLRVAELPPAPVEDVVVRRLSHAYPIYRVGFEDSFRALDRWVEKQPRVVTFGRQGLFAHDNTHHALAMAWAAADALGSDGGIDDTSWSEARARFADHVVED
jgi:protoporphyrinogen oxidase